MLFFTAAVAALAGLASARPTIRTRAGTSKTGVAVSNSTTPDGGYQQVVYWGQSQSKPLEEVCKEDVDTVVLSFVNLYGNETKDGVPIADPGWVCWTNVTDATDPLWGYAKTGCDLLGKNISSCQAAGKKVTMSVGGWIDYSVLAEGEGTKLADDLWNQYGEGSGTPVMGGVTLDGFDFDIEHDNEGNGGVEYINAIKELRSKFAGAKKQYKISGAPMCVTDNNIMAKMMDEAQFDELYFQYYNNACGVPSAAPAAWDSWYKTLQTGASKGAKIFLGMMGSPTAGQSEYFLQNDDMKSLVNTMKQHKGFAGVMVYDAGYAMNQTTGSNDYLTEVSSVLKTGNLA